MRRSISDLGLAVGALAGGPIETRGELRESRAWSTMKLPVIVAAIAAGRADGIAIEAAITRSDNDAALRLWGELDDGAAEVEAQLRAAGDHETTLEREPDPRGYSSFGRTVWSLPAAVRFYGRSRAASCSSRRDRPHPRRHAPDRARAALGLGAADPPIPSRAAGVRAIPGGGYEVIQVGISGTTVIAIAARAQDFEAAKRLASKHVPQHPNTP